MRSDSLPRRVAIVSPAPWHATDSAQFSIDLTVYADAFAAIGIESLIVCPPGSQTAGSRFPTVLVQAAEFEQETFWRSLNVDAALTLSWLGQAAIFRAQRDAGVFTASKADSNGRVSARLWPRESFNQLVVAVPSMWLRARRFRYWLQLLIRDFKVADRAVLASLSAADVTAVETIEARNALRVFAQHYDRLDLVERVRTWPHCVSPAIIASPLPDTDEKIGGIVAIGRWDAPQKDHRLLASAIHQLLSHEPTTEVVLIGKASDVVFADLSRRHPTVQCLGALPREAIAAHLRRARVIVFSSLWESFHIAVHEALCLGASVAGPFITPMPDLLQADGPKCASVARTRSGGSLGAAISQELEAWRAGRRDPAAIAGYWRARVSPDTVVSDFVDLFAKWKQGSEAYGAPRHGIA